MYHDEHPAMAWTHYVHTSQRAHKTDSVLLIISPRLCSSCPPSTMGETACCSLEPAQPEHTGSCPLPSLLDTCTSMAQRHVHRMPAAPPAVHRACLEEHILCSPPANPSPSATRIPRQPLLSSSPASLTPPSQLTILGSSLQLVLSSTLRASSPPVLQGRG